MNRTALITIISAIVIAAVIGIAAFMFMGSDGSMNHRMDDGSTMVGTMNGGTTP